MSEFLHNNSKSLEDGQGYDSDITELAINSLSRTADEQNSVSEDDNREDDYDEELSRTYALSFFIVQA